MSNGERGGLFLKGVSLCVRHAQTFQSLLRCFLFSLEEKCRLASAEVAGRPSPTFLFVQVQALGPRSWETSLHSQPQTHNGTLTATGACRTSCGWAFSLKLRQSNKYGKCIVVGKLTCFRLCSNLSICQKKGFGEPPASEAHPSGFWQ